MQAISGPSVWTGEELSSRDDVHYQFSEQDVGEIREALDDSPKLDGPIYQQAALAMPTIAARCKELQSHLEHGSGVIRLNGFPVHEFSQADITRFFVDMTQRIGSPLPQTEHDDRVFHVRNEGYKLDDPKARGPNTAKRLSFHTDRCDVIAFLCVKQAASGGENQLVSSGAIYNHIYRTRPDLLAVLMEPYCYKRHSVDTANPRPFCMQPIFSFCEGRFAASFLRVLIDRADADPDLPNLSDMQRQALDYLEETAELPGMQLEFRQQPGDILLLNNWTILHRRSAFVDHNDPDMRRHLLRIWLSVPNSRPLDPMFKDNFGDTRAGAIRGGFPLSSQ